MKLTTLHSTVFKTSPVDSKSLHPKEYVEVKKGESFDILAHKEADSNHVKATLSSALSNGRNTFYIYKPHVKIEGNEPGNSPNDKSVNSEDKTIKLPGFSSEFRLKGSIIPEGNFTWGEATHNGTRIPENKTVVLRIVTIARHMEAIRSRLGNRPITITSWYRPPHVNRAVGGASQSRHILGDAVDFSVAGYSPYEVYKQLDGWWDGLGGLAYSNPKGFCHVDARGYKARWIY